MKIKSLTALLLAGLLLMGACTPHDGAGSMTDLDTSAQITEVESTAAIETTLDATTEESEPQPEPPPALSLAAKTLTTDGETVVLDLSCLFRDETFAGELIFRLSDSDGQIAEKRMSASETEQRVTLTCPKDRINGTLTVVAEAISSEGEVVDSLHLTMQKGIVQLSEDAVSCVVAAMTLEEKTKLTSGGSTSSKPGAVGATLALRKYGIPSIGFNDGPAGVRSDMDTPSVWYPSVTNISSSWDPDLIYRVGEAIGLDGRAFGTDILLAPGMNIQKNIFGGRNFEYSSEDPLLTGYLMSAYVDGLQSTGIGAEIKHFAVNNQETSRVIYSANVTERALREIYLKGFGIVVRDSSPWAVMSSYNRINRNHNATERELLVNILRNEFGFTGMVTSDWGGVTGSIDHKINAMNDLNMPGNADDPAILVNAVNSGTVSMEALDACCINILSVVAKTRTAKGEKKEGVDYVAHAELARQAAANSFVLLKNENTLPLKSGASIALFGNGSTQTVYGGGGSGVVHSKINISIFDGIKASTSLKLYDESGSPFRSCQPHDVNDPSKDVAVTESYAKQCAGEADTAVIVLSRQAIEGVDSSNRLGDYRLNQTELDMITRVSEAFHAQGKQVTVLINTGNPIETASWQSMVDAILYVGYAGEQTGHAVADVLSGKVNPSGKLTSTWPLTFESTPAYDYFPGGLHDVTYYEDIYVGYRYYETFGVNVAYPFGYGLSYTSFTYSDPVFKYNKDGSITISVTVTNTGKTAGREIVQCYVSKPETTLEQAKLELGGFAKTGLLAPNQSETVSVTITEDALKSYDEGDSAWILDSGAYTISIGASVKDIKFTDTFTVSEKQIILDVDNQCVPEVEFDYITKKTYTVPIPETRKNLAEGASVNASKGDGRLAVDGDTCSLWNPAQDGATITLDLGSTREIGEMTINWYAIHTAYMVQVSTNGATYTDYKCYVDNGTGYNIINLHGTEARYIRIKIIRADNQGIYEWRVYEAIEADKNSTDPFSGENLALRKPATANNVEGGNAPAYAVDGNYDTRWSSQQSGDATLTVDLKSVHTIKAIELVLESAWVPYRIEYSTDGETYHTLFEGKKDELMVILTDLNIEARYLRAKRDGENWFSIYEFKIFG